MLFLLLLFFVALMVWLLRSATAYGTLWKFLILFPKPQWLRGLLKCVSSRGEMFRLSGLCPWIVFPILYFQLWHPLELQCRRSRDFFILLLLCLVCYVQGVYRSGSGNPTGRWLPHFLTPSPPNVPTRFWRLASYIFCILTSALILPLYHV